MEDKKLVKTEPNDSCDLPNKVLAGVTKHGHNFNEVLKYLETLSDYSSKIKYLNENVIRCESMLSTFDLRRKTNERIEISVVILEKEFIKLHGLCKIKLNELERLAKLEFDQNPITPLEIQQNLEQSEEHPDQSILIEEDFTLRRKVIALMFLTYGRLEMPEDITPEKVVRFFHGITGGDIKKLRKVLSAPTAYKEGDKRSIKILCDDLNFVRNQLVEIGIKNDLEKIKNEIEWLIKDLEEKT